jgi:hypothetical protein
VVRGIPAALYRHRLGPRKAAIAGLMQATSLPFIVTATQIGVAVDAIDTATAAGLVAAGLLSVVLFPPAALARLRRLPEAEAAGTAGRPAPAALLAHRPMGTQL